MHTERELARRDELTGVRNQTAYHELEKSIQENIDNGLDYLTFALVVCDANNLKQINDTGELHLSDVIRKNQIPSEKWDEQGVLLYNLDAIIAVDYRVNEAKALGEYEKFWRFKTRHSSRTLTNS